MPLLECPLEIWPLSHAPVVYSLREAAAKLNMIRLTCPKCHRRGQYRVDRLLKKYGPDISMPDLRHELAQCPHRRDMDGGGNPGLGNAGYKAGSQFIGAHVIHLWDRQARFFYGYRIGIGRMCPDLGRTRWRRSS
jgi:hypothetical protein